MQINPTVAYICTLFGSNRSKMFCKKGVLKNFAKFTFSFLNKVSEVSNFVKEDTLVSSGCFSLFLLKLHP